MAVTRADVAREAGVSPALVSYVLNDGPRPVSAQARKRVEEAIERLDYRPNQIARALRASRTRSIGMLMPDHNNPHFAELAQAVEDEAYRRQYMLVLGTTNNDSERERGYLRTFFDRQLDGLLLISATSSLDETAIDRSRIPVVLLDRAPAGADCSTVVIDNERAAERAVRHLIEHGYGAPACLSGPTGIEAVRLRELGWRRAVGEGDAEVGELVNSEFSREGGYRAMRSLLERASRPRAVFVASDVQAIGALRACREAGVRVPEDLAVVSFDGTDAGSFTDPALTSVDQRVARLAEAAVGLLLDRIGAAGPPEHRVLEAGLRQGGSCGCAPRA